MIALIQFVLRNILQERLPPAVVADPFRPAHQFVMALLLGLFGLLVLLCGFEDPHAGLIGQ